MSNLSLPKCIAAAGLTWQGRQHSALDDARNTANLAIKLMKEGTCLEMNESFSTNKLVWGRREGKQATLFKAGFSAVVKAPKLSAGAKGGVKDAGLCKCGVKAVLRKVRKPGKSMGREFRSCGRYSALRQKGECDFFEWVDEV